MRCHHNQPITLLAPASFSMSAACGERFFVLYKVMMITLQRVPQESDMSSSKTHTRSLTSPTLSRCGLELYQMPLLVRNPHDCHYLQDMSRTECAIKVLDSWPCLLAKAFLSPVSSCWSPQPSPSPCASGRSRGSASRQDQRTCCW